MRRCASFTFFSLTWLCIAGTACNLDNPGDEPPVASLYFPTALTLSPSTAGTAPKLLFVVSSNFDLRYNAGSVQAFDLDALDAAVGDCAKPGRDCIIDTNAVLADEALIPSLATGIVVSRERPRLYVTTRTETSLTFVDFDEDAEAKGERVLRCGLASSRKCDDAHQRGEAPVQNGRRLRMPAEPVSLITGHTSDWAAPDEPSVAGDYVLVAHRGGEVSLFLEQTQDDGTSGPVLIDVLSGLPLELTGITFDPSTQMAYASVFARRTPFSQNKILSRVGLALEPDAPLDSYLYSAGTLDIDGVGFQRDTRAVGTSPAVPGQVLVVSRSPASLLWVDVQAAMEPDLTPVQAPARRIVEVGAGPSRLTVGEIGGRSLVAVSSFDAKQLFVLDAQNGATVSIVHNLSGPFELAIDSARQRLYIAEFRSSVVRIVDLSPLVTGALGGETTARVVATLGRPRQVQEFQ